jgi:lysophospholipase L1-like esterase
VSSSIREFAARPNVMLCDEHAFDALEHPELFGDGMHLNRAGVAIFSPMLAERIAQILGPSGAAR